MGLLKKRLVFLLRIVYAFFLTIPISLAFSSRIKPIDSAFSIIGSLFNAPSLQNEAVAVGFARFAFFIAIFAILHYAALRVFNDDVHGKRTASIVSFVIALLSAFFVPRNVVLSSATLYSALVWSFVSLAPVGYAVYFAFKTKDDTNPALKFLEIIALMASLVWTLVVTQNLISWLRSPYPNVASIVDTVVSYTSIFLIIAIIYKIFKLFTSGSGDDPDEGSGGGPDEGSGGGPSGGPGPVTGVTGRMVS